MKGRVSISEAKRDPEKMNTFCIENEKMIHEALRIMKIRPESYEDMFQVGSMYLFMAVKRFSKSKGFKFSTFAMNYITGGIRCALERKCHTVIKMPRWYNYAKKLSSEGKTIDEISKIIGRKKALIELAMKRSAIMSLDEKIGFERDDDKSSSLHDVLTDSNNVADTVTLKILIDQTKNTYFRMETHRRIIDLYVAGLTISDISPIIGKTKQLVSKVVIKFREALGEELKITA